MRSVSVWIMLVAVSLVVAWEIGQRGAGAGVPSLRTSGSLAPAGSGGPAAPTAGVSRERREERVAAVRRAVSDPAPAPAPTPSAAASAGTAGTASGVGSVVGSAPMRARRYAGLADAALAKGDRLHAALYASAWVHAAEGAVRDRARALALRLEREAVVAANRASAAGDGSGQRRDLTVAYLATPDPARRARYRAILEELARALVLTPGDSPDLQVHVVRSGESLARLARRYGVPVDGIRRLNRLRSTVIRVGQRLRVWRGPVEVVVCKREFRLTLLQAGRFVRAYPCGIGKQDSTPEARFTIVERQVDPTWYGPNGVFPPGDPGNLLGTRWLGFRDTAEYRGFGIHGTRMPESIGKAASSGCIRLRNADVEDLFSFVPRGAQVTIVR